MTGWQPIETAPHHKKILLWWPDATSAPLASWQCLEGGDEDGTGWVFAWCMEDDNLSEHGDGWIYADSHQPTHWMPLPDPPEDKTYKIIWRSRTSTEDIDTNLYAVEDKT